jgi:GTP-binding protein era
MLNNQSEHFKSGFVAVVGRPNVGKSTLINALIGDKIVIVSDKAQTTRNRIICVYTDQEKQIVFMDTPGIHKPKHKLGEFMVTAAVDSLKEVEAVLFLVAANEKRGPGDNFIIEQLQKVKVPVYLCINKIDTLTKEDLLKVIVSYQDAYPFAGVIPISALEKENLDVLLDELTSKLPEGPQYFPEDMITDQPERLLISDMIREKILLTTRDEVPHSIAVEVEEMKTRDDGTTYIRATIFVERDSQKGIIIGNKGAMLKQLGAQSRLDIQRLLGTKVYLDLWVKVKKDWRNKSGMLSELGYKA